MRTEQYISSVPLSDDPEFVRQSPPHWTDKDDKLDKLREQYVAPTGDPELSRNIFYEYHAQEFIDNCAVYDNGTLNIEITAKRLGIPVAYGGIEGFHKAQIEGIGRYRGVKPLLIRLDKELKTDLEETLSFGHEVGHYFLADIAGIDPEGYSHEVERFCDYFGRAMAFNKRFISEVGQVDENKLLELCNRHRISITTVILQLIERGKLPPRVAIDTYHGKVKNPDYSQKVGRNYICLHCTECGGDSNCPNKGQDGRLFDFTDRAWAASLPNCCGEVWTKPPAMSMLTKFYESKANQLVLFRPGAKYEDD